MRTGRFNRAQRVVVVIGLGVGLYFFGAWVTTRGTVLGGGTGWVAYAPLTNPYTTPNAIGGLHPWVRLVIWLLLVVVWVAVSLVLVRSTSTSTSTLNDSDSAS